MAKITQIAGRNALGTFAPDFAHFNDDILFGENWNNEDIDLKTRSIITVVALFCDGIARTLFAPTEVSISTVTAVFLVPVVIVMMLRRQEERG